MSAVSSSIQERNEIFSLSCFPEPQEHLLGNLRIPPHLSLKFHRGTVDKGIKGWSGVS